MGKIETEHTFNPTIIKEIFGEDTLVGASKMVFCEHPRQTLFGGHAKPNITNTNGEWRMAVGSLIFVPLKTLVWADGMCGWSIEDILRDGMEKDLWKEA